MNLRNLFVCIFLVSGFTAINGFKLWLPSWFSKSIKIEIDTSCSDSPGVYLPIDNSCNSYHLCINGELSRFSCPKGMYLDAEAGYCKKDTESICDTTTTTTESEDTTTELIETTTTTESPICSPELNGHFLPGDECNSYYFCTQNEAVLLKCPSGQMFSEELEYCIADSTGICRGSITTEESVTTEETSDTTQENSSTEEPGTTEEPTGEPTEGSSTVEPITDNTTAEENETTEGQITSEEPSTSVTDISEATSSSTEESSNSTEPSISTEEPSISTEDPSISTEEPSSSTEEPSVSTEEPPVSTEEPSISTEEPSISTEESSVATEEPSVSTEEPSASTEEPWISTEEPSISTEEPSVSTEEPSVSSEQPPEPTTNEPQATTKSDNVCEGVTIGAVPHKDCDKYYFCNQEVPTVQVCPEGDYFDKNANECTEDVNKVCLSSEQKN